MGDELLPKRSPDRNQRLLLINGIYHVIMKHSHSKSNILETVIILNFKEEIFTTKEAVTDLPSRFDFLTFEPRSGSARSKAANFFKLDSLQQQEERGN